MYALAGALLGGNEFAQGGLTLMLLGGAAAGAAALSRRVAHYAARSVMVTAEIDSRDDAYRWVCAWHHIALASLHWEMCLPIQLMHAGARC